ncbi:MAG: hypothetical protein ACRDEB_00195 [Chitinophagaceae bacterium]
MKRKFLYSILIAILVVANKQAAAQQHFSVTLRLNYAKDVKLYHDESLILTVTLTNQEARENSRWNKAADRRLKELEELIQLNKISRDDYDKEKRSLMEGKRKVSVITIGTESNPWSQSVKWKIGDKKSGVEIMLPVKPLTNPTSEAVAILDEKGYYVSYFGVSPEDMKKTPGGSYSIAAIVDGVSSEEAGLEIKSEAMPAIISGSEEMILRTGQYYWHSNDAAKTIQFAEMILAKNPVSLDGLSLKGDGQVLQQSYQQALETFNKAVKEYYRQNGTVAEPPEYLLETISWIKKQLGQ